MGDPVPSSGLHGHDMLRVVHTRPSRHTQNINKTSKRGIGADQWELTGAKAIRKKQVWAASILQDA